jgi:hypothetical protein
MSVRLFVSWFVPLLPYGDEGAQAHSTTKTSVQFSGEGRWEARPPGLDLFPPLLRNPPCKSIKGLVCQGFESVGATVRILFVPICVVLLFVCVLV